MSPLQSPSLPISPPCFASARYQTPHETLVVDSSVENRKLLSPQSRRGNRAPLPIVSFFVRLQSSRRVRRFRTIRLNSRLPTRSEAELVDFVEGASGRFPSVETQEEANDVVGFSLGNNGEFPKKDDNGGCEENGVLPSLVKEGLSMPKKESFDFDDQNGDLGISRGGDAGGVVMSKEQGNLITNELGLDSCRRSGCLLDDNVMKSIRRLPIEECVKILDLVQCDGNSLTISDYNDILVALVKARELDSAVDLFSTLESHDISLDTFSYSIMVQCWCKKNEPDEARRVLDEMMQRGFNPNVITFTNLVNCLCKRGRVTKAFEVFEIMSRIGCEPTIWTYNCLIGGLCYVGRLEEALELLKKIKNSSKKPDIYTFTLVIDGFCKVSRSDEAMDLLKEAERTGIVPTVVTYNALLNGYCKENRPLEALHLLKDMQQAIGCKPDLISYSIVLQGLLRVGEISSAWKTFKKMNEVGFEADKRAMNTLLRGLCKQSMTNNEVLKDAKELFKKIQEVSYGPSPYTYCLMIQALAKGGEIDEAVAHLHEMMKEGYSPRIMTYNVVLRVLCDEGRVYEALDLLLDMITRDVIPSRFSFSIVLNEFCRQGQMLDAYSVYAAAIKRGVIPYWKRKDERKDNKESDQTLDKEVEEIAN
ncbi:pentatricopeptide repeat-containing protein At5g41170, mitochondrial-like [Ananas comosus]|uniref:Pentatricopeptide repeat-containing protein At5g41170, mitochondrial-like n=1 Tax=Ananas comosus TaxID=4615 RepID=A0A6P5GTP5_ANACO|nr:pentatricopeptide repeat-containing protein At5g41170, mitochondrial-like [Ananas comosus]